MVGAVIVSSSSLSSDPGVRDTLVSGKSISCLKVDPGDLLFTLQCYADKKNYDIINILDTANKKFEKRFKKLKELAKLENIELNKASIETKERLWKKAKKKANLP